MSVKQARRWKSQGSTLLNPATIISETINDINAICWGALRIKIFDNRSQLYADILEDRDLGIPNPWVWISVICWALGLKMSKVLIELKISKEARTRNA